MAGGKLIFSQLTEFIPRHTFRRCVDHYHGNRYIKTFNCWDQYLTMSFAQLTWRESLRDIEACLRAMAPKLYHMGIHGNVSRNTLSNANARRDWRIWADFAQALIAIARPLHIDEDFGVELEQTAYALDATTIDLCLSLFPWASFRQRKGGIKVHTLLDLRGNIPVFVHITPAQLHEVNLMNDLCCESGAVYIMDRGYLDFARLFKIHRLPAFFVTRVKSNTQTRRIGSRPVDKDAGLICDQDVLLTVAQSRQDYPERLRRVVYVDQETGQSYTYLTNHFSLPALSIAGLYSSRWQIELFFKWIKQHLRLNSFYGTSDNAVRTQIWIAISVYLLVAIIRKKLRLEVSLHTLLQVLSLTLFEKIPIKEAICIPNEYQDSSDDRKQLDLFDF